MIAALGRAVVRYRRAVLLATLAFLLAAGAVGGGVASRLSGGGFDDPASASSRAGRALATTFHSGEPNFVLLVQADGGVDRPAAARAGVALTEALSQRPEVSNVASYWTTGHLPALRSHDGTEALIVARVPDGRGGDDAPERARHLKDAFAGEHGPLTVRAGGSSIVFAAIGDRIQSDLSRAEAIAFPVTFVLLVLVFGGVVAALLPLAIGVLSVLGTLLILRGITSLTDVSIYALNLTTGMGLGLAIDYSLFVVTRYREELARGLPTADAIVATLRTAGRTVAFSAVTIALSLSALLVFPLYFLRSFAYAGIAVVALAATGAVVVLPALLAVLGRRVDAWTLWRRKPADATSGFWQRTASAVMRRPVYAGGAVLALLLLLGTPFLGAHFGLPDDRVLPRDHPAHQVSQSLRDDFGGRADDTLQVVLPDATSDAAVQRYAAQVARVDGVTGVRTHAGDAGGHWLEVTSSVEPYSGGGKDLVADLRALPAPSTALVGGAAAALVDTEHSLGERLPLAGGIIAVAMIVVLFLFTGSVVVPLKAIVLNLLSLSATFGAMVWIFQEGHLSGLVGSPIVTGTLDTTVPILMFCVAFGLSMDYEVFLLSRIKETYDATRDNTTAVSVGLERTGRLVTAAAALIAVVWITFVSSGITFIKMLGLGMALAVVVDATLVRGVLVPAFMRLAGDWNWWAPAPLRRLHARFGVREAAEAKPVAPAAVETA